MHFSRHSSRGFDAAAKDYESVATTQTVVEVAFPVVVVLLLVSLARFIVRRGRVRQRKASPVSS